MAISSVGICLPMVAVVAFGIRFVICDVPRIAEAEHRAVVLQYREKLDDLKDDPSKWQDLSETSDRPFVRAQPRAKEIWGYWDLSREAVGRTMLWRQVDGKKRGVYVETIPEIDYRRLLTAASCVTMLLLSVLTVWALLFFIRYAHERDDFVRATAHDLTTPLVAMRRMIGRDDSRAKALADRLMRLVENLSVFLSLGGRRPAPARETFDLRAVCEEAYALFDEGYRESPNCGPVPIEGPEDIQINGDRTMTMQILWNLLANDLKYAAPFGRVRIRLKSSGTFALVEFVDEGRGLAARERKRIFRRYYRAQSVMKSGKGGFGIGLCTAREFAREMGGDVTVAANLPHGCVFAVRLPLAVRSSL